MDSMKHVNNVVYLKKFESARIDYLLQIENLHAQTSNFLDGKSVGPIMRSANIAWKYPVTYPDQITVLSKVDKVELDRFYLSMILVSHNAQRLAARITECEVTVDYRKLPTAKTPVPEKWQEIFASEMSVQADWESEFS